MVELTRSQLVKGSSPRAHLTGCGHSRAPQSSLSLSSSSSSVIWNGSSSISSSYSHNRQERFQRRAVPLRPGRGSDDPASHAQGGRPEGTQRAVCRRLTATRHRVPPEASPPVDASPFDSFTNHSTRFYGSPSDYEARERVHAALSELLASLDQPKPVGIGHNNPPKAIEPLTLANIRSDANELEKEFGKRAPSISLIRRIATSLYNSAVEITKWLGRKADLAVDVAIKTIVPAITVAIGTTHSGSIHRVIGEIISWLTVVAHKVM